MLRLCHAKTDPSIRNIRFSDLETRLHLHEEFYAFIKTQKYMKYNNYQKYNVFHNISYTKQTLLPRVQLFNYFHRNVNLHKKIYNPIIYKKTKMSTIKRCVHVLINIYKCDTRVLIHVQNGDLQQKARLIWNDCKAMEAGFFDQPREKKLFERVVASDRRDTSFSETCGLQIYNFQ